MKNNDQPAERRQYHTRKSPRATFHDYSGGAYFITICTRDKLHFFGEIADGEMHRSPLGHYVDATIASLETHYSYARVMQYVVMPNHIHAIIIIDARQRGASERETLGVVVGGLKQAVTRYARLNNIEFAWHSRYHDHIIRGSVDNNFIVDYIENNVARWGKDCFYRK